MQTSNGWKQFERTGRIADYLAYKNSCKNSGEDRQEAPEETTDGQKQAGSEDVCRNSFT